MNVLVLAAQTWDAHPVPCRFTVEVDEVAVEVSTVPFDAVLLPDGAQSVHIAATPQQEWLWDDQFHLIVTGDQVDPVPAEAAKLATDAVSAPGVTITRVTMTVSRLRDVSSTAAGWLGLRPPMRDDEADLMAFVMDRPDFPPVDWSLPDRPATRFVDAANPVDGGRIGIVARDAVGSDVECAVFAVAGVSAPKLIAVSWPTALLRDENSDPTPFLIYFHPAIAKRIGWGYYVGPGLGPYPWNFDFCYYVLYGYQWYGADPLADTPYPKGIPFQIAAAGKPVVAVQPCNAPAANEFGVFTDAAATETLLLDLQALMFRRAGARQGPATLGRTAVGAFSSGNNYIAALLASPANRSHPFCQNTLGEVYCFDPPQYLTGALTATALNWAGASETGRRVALYTQFSDEAHTKLLGSPLPAVPFVQSSPDGTRTAAVLPIAAWRATAEAATGRGWPQWDFQMTHQIIAAMMLTHAVATSRL